MTENWHSLQANLADVLAGIRVGQFVIIEYDAGLADVQPYAQSAREGEGYYCEVVSENFLSRQKWPILHTSLERYGWHVPSAADENWWCFPGDEPIEVAETLIAGLRDGRVCRDPSRFTCEVGTFPPTRAAANQYSRFRSSNSPALPRFQPPRSATACSYPSGATSAV